MAESARAAAASPSAGPSRAGYHRVALWQTCRRKFGYVYGLRLQPIVTSLALSVGSLLHIARMWYYLRLRAGRDTAGLLDPVGAMRTAPARLAWCYEHARRVWDAYVPWAARVDDFTVLDVEREYEAKLGGRLFTARLDLVYERHGRVWIDDFKSTSGSVAKHHLEWQDSGQMAMQHLLGECVLPGLYKLPFGGVTVTVAGTGDRQEFARNELAVGRQWRGSVAASIERALADIEAAGLLDQTTAFKLPVSPEACRGRWGVCEYRRLCDEGAAALGCGEWEQAVDVGTRLQEGAPR